MASQTVSKKIGAHVYACRMLPAGTGLRVLARLMNLIGPAIKAYREDGDTLSNVVAELLTNEKLADQLEFFTGEFRNHSSIESEGRSQELANIYDVHFAGNYFELVQWLVFCFEVNHGSFLADAGVSVQSLLVLVQRELSSRSPKASAKSGPSGQSSSPAGSTKPSTVSVRSGP